MGFHLHMKSTNVRVGNTIRPRSLTMKGPSERSGVFTTKSRAKNVCGKILSIAITMPHVLQQSKTILKKLEIFYSSDTNSCWKHRSVSKSYQYARPRWRTITNKNEICRKDNARNRIKYASWATGNATPYCSISCSFSFGF